MGMLCKYYKELTSSAGSLVFNTDDIRGSSYRIFVKPPNESVEYDIKFTDDNSLDVYVLNGNRGTVRDLTAQSMKGIYTVTISNITADGIFKFQLEWEEKA